MIDITKATVAFKRFLEKYTDEMDTPGFNLKVVHTYHVLENAQKIAMSLKLSPEDIALAELIALLHDIGRFEELAFLKKFDSVKFDHAAWGVKMLFEDNFIRDFILDDKYDEIIKIAIGSHSKLSIPDGLDDKALLHTKIIRDADKLDNFRVKKEEKIENIFPGKVQSSKDMETSKISDKVYVAIQNHQCVDIHDRIYPLDYWLCVLAFVFDLNFPETFKIIKENDYINILVNRFSYDDAKVNAQMEIIRNILNDYVNVKV